MAREPASRANNSAPTDVPPMATEPIPDTAVSTDRTGQDERRRGWFWHWNGIVTQYTPLIGLKGIGLLNSYTVWTDRREDSPHRGYAFPSQQSEANFYGEDRAELITINKILVALDLIEIRKEMVRKTDDKGRRWKVPQNLYRVKDRQDGLDLTAADVIRVIELADGDKAVYRYIRKVFSNRFDPIDRNNVWHAILTELADHPTWQKLSARAAKQEARASARTKAGHRARARQQEEEQPDLAPTASDKRPTTAKKDSKEPPLQDSHAAEITSGHIKAEALPSTKRAHHHRAAIHTTDESANNGARPADEESNNGFNAPVESGNYGSSSPEGGSVANANNGRKSSVEPGNTMYYQSPSTTTTTTTSSSEIAGQSTLNPGAPSTSGGDSKAAQGKDPLRLPDAPEIHDESGQAKTQRDINGKHARAGTRTTESGLDRAAGGGPLGDPSPLALSLYEAANDRAATGLERILLSELEADATPSATAAGSTGPEWVAAALREAVGSGSSFVAPKRIREIISRWSSTGSGPRGPEETYRAGNTSRSEQHVKFKRDENSGDSPGTQMVQVSREDAVQGERLWEVVLDMLAVEGHGDALFRLRGVVPLGERADGAFVLGAPTRTAVRLLESRRGQVENALSSLLSAPVSIDMLDPDEWAIER